MRKHFLLSVLLLGALCCSTPVQADNLDQWEQGSIGSRPSTWWHWLDCNVTREGITADLEAMARMGYHEVQVFNASNGLPTGSVQYLTPQWLSMFKWAAQEAERLGLTLCMHNCPGWSSSGGYWIKPEYSMQRLVWTETKLSGTGAEQTLKLGEPRKERNYYEDIIVIAFPTPQTNQRIPQYELKSLGTQSFPDKMLPKDPKLPETATVSKDDVLDISTCMQADGTLTWKAPAGEWTILRMGHTSTGKDCHPTSPATGGGLEVDKLSRKAMDEHWKGGIQPILDYLGPLAGTVFNNLLIDSYEVGCGNWTDGFDREFKARRGYDIVPYLPAMAGYVVEGGLQSERFLWDWRKTVGQLMVDNYYTYFGDLCHQHGMQFCTEPYTGPFDDLEVGAPADMVMGEFWVGSTGHTSMKVASSIAHFNGQSVVGAESFTAADPWTGWDGSPARIKALGDLAWCEGINHYIYHTYVHQPYNIGPGFTLGQFASHFNRLNTLWEPAKAWHQYVQRSQYLLQQGKFVGDILVFNGESSPNDGLTRPEIKEMGYDYDEIWSAAIAQLKVRDGRLITPQGGSYRMLVLPHGDMLTPEFLQVIYDLAKQGATIIGPRPTASPSLQNYPQCDQEVNRLAAELWDKGLIRDESVKQAIARLALKPDFSAQQGQTGLNFIHRSAPEGEIYFVSNQTAQHVRPVCSFRVTGLQPERWDSETGEIQKLMWSKGEDGQTQVMLDLQGEQSCFVIFRGIAEKHLEVTGMKVYVPSSLVRLTPDLTLTSARYGHFLPYGVMDVTERVAARLKDGNLQVTGSNTAFGDPCFGKVKCLQITYVHDGKESTFTAPENSPVELDHVERVLSAYYGDVPADMTHEGAENSMDVREKILAMFDQKEYIIQPNDAWAGMKDDGRTHELRLTVTLAGKEQHLEVPAGGRVDFSDLDDAPQLLVKSNVYQWRTAQPGTIRLTTEEGMLWAGNVKEVDAALAVDGPWDVNLIDPYGTEFKTQLPELISLSKSEDENLRYFSGTAVYTHALNIPAKLLKSGNSLDLNLGKVQAIAEVIINGVAVDTLWKAPYVVNLDGKVHAGTNQLQVRVTIPWRNRLIGDEQLPQDVRMSGVVPAELPAWITDMSQRQSKRTTFYTWKHWDEKSELQDAGLMGPVELKPYKVIPLKVPMLIKDRIPQKL